MCVGRREKREQIRQSAWGRTEVRKHYKTGGLSRWEEKAPFERTP